MQGAGIRGIIAVNKRGGGGDRADAGQKSEVRSKKQEARSKKMLAGAGNTHQWVNQEADAMSNVENAFRRIMHNVRTASALTAPTTGTLTSTLTVKTQVDRANGNVAATVTYAIVNGNLVETDSRYAGNSIQVPGVTAFTVQKMGATPTQLNVSITAGPTPPVTRTATVTCRNL
jgi:hypothetical protein